MFLNGVVQIKARKLAFFVYFKNRYIRYIGEEMKKYIRIMIVCICISGMILLVKERKPKWDNIQFPSDTLLYQMDQDEIEAIGIKNDWYDCFVGYASLSLLEKERIFMVDTKNSEKIKKSLKMYLATLKIEDEVLWHCEDSYVFMVVSKNAKAIMDSIKEYV